MVFNSINFPRNFIYGITDNGKYRFIFHTFIPTEPPGYMIGNISTNVLYKKLQKSEQNTLSSALKLNMVD